MASIGCALLRIKSELDQWIDQKLVEQSYREANYRRRKRKLHPLSRAHLLMLQLLAQVALRGLRHELQLPVSAQAICAARMRLPLMVMFSQVRTFLSAIARPRPEGSPAQSHHLYGRGLFSDLARRSVEPIALASGAAVRTLQ